MPEPVPQHVAHVDIESEHSDSGEPEPTMGSIKLSAEQRDIAHRSGISEIEYAKQLLRMQKMQKSGLMKHQTTLLFRCQGEQRIRQGTG